MSRNLHHQADLFATPVFASREAAPAIDIGRFRSRLKRAMSAALKTAHEERGLDRHAVAAAMAAMGAPVSKAMLDAYTSEARTTHDISVVRFKAFCRAADARHLWDVAVCDDGLTVLAGDEARLAEIARLQQEQRAIAAELRRLTAVPVTIRRQHVPGAGE